MSKSNFNLDEGPSRPNPFSPLSRCKNNENSLKIFHSSISSQRQTHHTKKRLLWRISFLILLFFNFPDLLIFYVQRILEVYTRAINNRLDSAAVSIDMKSNIQSLFGKWNYSATGRWGRQLSFAKRNQMNAY